MSWYDPSTWEDGIGKAVLEALIAAWNWMVDTVVGFGQTVLAGLIGLFPTDANGQIASGWSTIANGIGAANAWAPIDFAITLAFAYVVFVFGFFSVKVVIKMIP